MTYRQPLWYEKESTRVFPIINPTPYGESKMIKNPKTMDGVLSNAVERRSKVFHKERRKGRILYFLKKYLRGYRSLRDE